MAIYNPADLYPPTISAVNELAASCETVVLVTTKQANEGFHNIGFFRDIEKICVPY